ncbi:hypothetical protein H0H81_002850, partial [Sphagnurus paluster]
LKEPLPVRPSDTALERLNALGELTQIAEKLDLTDTLDDVLGGIPAMHISVVVQIHTGTTTESPVHPMEAGMVLFSYFNDAIRDAINAPAPSSVSKDAWLFESEQHTRPIYNGRPASLRGPPIAIYHSAFAQLKDDLQRLDQLNDPREQRRVESTAQLYASLTKINPSEYDRRETVSHLARLLEVEVGFEFEVYAMNNVVEIEAFHELNYEGKVAVVAQVEVKNEVGWSGNSAIQNVLSLRKRLAGDQCNEIRKGTCCPCITICIAGPYISFGGAVFADIVIAEAFTDYIFLGGTREQILKTSRMFVAVARAIGSLRDYYGSLRLSSSRPGVRRLLPEPTYLPGLAPDNELVLTGRYEYEGRVPDNYCRALFQGTYNGTEVLVKFCETYHGQAHRLLAQAGRAPHLYFCERICGGAMMVIMELVKGRDARHYFSLNMPEEVMDDVRSAVDLLHENNLVFGDLRRSNIIIKETEDKKLWAMLIDFDWVGEAGKARYPPFLNDSGAIFWAQGVVGHGLMEKQHDLEMIRSLNP